MTAYPNKSGRAEALAAWRTMEPSPELQRDIVASIERHIKSHPQWQREGGRFIPRAAKWLADRGWEWRATAAPRDLKAEALDQMRRRREEAAALDKTLRREDAA